MKKNELPLVILAMLLWLRGWAFAQDGPRDPRTAPLPREIELAEQILFGGSIEAEVELANVDRITPDIVNGQLSSDLADVHFELQLRYRAKGQLGSKAAGEFVPYQNVRVTIRNTFTDETVAVDLVPHLGLEEGWHYASNVRLPARPDTDPLGPLNSYEITVAIIPSNVLSIHSDLMPPSSLLRGETMTMVLDQAFFANLRQSEVTQLPAGNVDKQLSRVADFEEIGRIRKDGSLSESQKLDQIGALYIGGQLQALAQKREGDFTRGPEAPVLDQPIVDAINGTGASANESFDERMQRIDKGLQRVFYLSILHELDEVSEKLSDSDPDNDADIVDGAAHNLDEAWAYYQALDGTAEKRVRNKSSEFPQFAGTLDEVIEQSFLDGQNAILKALNPNADLAIAERKLVQIFYLSVIHEVIGVVDKLGTGNIEGANESRVEGEGFYSAIQYLIIANAPSADQRISSKLSTEFASAADFSRADGDAIVADLNLGLSGVLQASEMVGGLP
ncbi:MAG: iron transporter [bacterium]